MLGIQKSVKRTSGTFDSTQTLGLEDFSEKA
jgi:hypothetical protein